ncbi:MAG: ABC transporter permease [Clostridia bacterium]|nr:ABC transporter permease [Clostridia bacterium]
MKITSIRYLVGEGFKNLWVNRLMSIASIGVLMACMVIIGLATLITENVNKAIGNLEQQNVVIAYMKDYNWALLEAEIPTSEEGREGADENGILQSDYVIHSEDEAKALCDKISGIANVAEVEFITSEEGLKTVQQTLNIEDADSQKLLGGENPISCSAKIRMTDMSLFDKTVEEISKLDGIYNVQSHSDLASTITAIKNGVGVAGVWIIAILMVIALVIVSNTIRVTMYNRKLEISIMKAVGATDTFVRIPFVVEGVAIGAISALLAEGILYFCYRVATEAIINTLNTTDIVKYGDMAWILLVMFLGIGLVAGIFGSVIMINKYLRKEGSEFAAI